MVRKLADKFLYCIRVTYLILWSKKRCIQHRDRAGIWLIATAIHMTQCVCSECFTESGQDTHGRVIRSNKHAKEKWEVEGVIGVILHNLPFTKDPHIYGVYRNTPYYYWQRWAWRHELAAEVARARQAEEVGVRMDRLAETARIWKEHQKTHPGRVSRARLLRRD